MSQNGQTQFKNFTASVAGFLKVSLTILGYYTLKC